MAIGPNSIPYVVYTSSTANGRKLNVKKLNGTQWEFVGAENFGLTTDPLVDVSITVTPDGKIFVAAKRWNDNGSGDKNTVYHYNQSSGSRETLGSDYISDGMAENNVIKYDANTNSLILVYSQSGTRVRKFTLPTTTPACNNTDPGSNAGDTGCVTFNYKGQSVTYTTVRGADGKVWLQQNLGSTKTATSLTDADAYGDLFQWGRWDDGHQVRTSALSATAPTPNNPSGLNGGNTTFYSAGYMSSSNFWSGGASSNSWSAENATAVSATNGADPCKALGTNWRMPTITEIDNVIAAENITENNSGLASNLKLIPAGMKDYNGIYSPGTRLYLWSSSVSQDPGKAEHFYASQFSALSNTASRDAGMSVRCIKSTNAALSVSDISNSNSLGIYPNPTNGILNIKTDSQITQASVTNLVGQRMPVELRNNQIDMTSFAKGIYIIEVQFKNGQKVSKKIIKN
ncbi:T9SS type A sorting domain-containing protein [Chryseobacterium sp.]|uniref:T9SS type A sorting domain-containing protein n=1 Tax=Chryseobacterium sp. TaxID=1871047 RepID=UPI00289E6971|nr:T9SS type A sorting domain-containing protein [Chryseobacterium sp.]